MLESSHLAVRLTKRASRVITTHSSSDKKYNKQQQDYRALHLALLFVFRQSRRAIFKTFGEVDVLYKHSVQNTKSVCITETPCNFTFVEKCSLLHC